MKNNKRLIALMAVSLFVSVGQIWAMPGKVLGLQGLGEMPKVEGCTDFGGQWKGTCNFGQVSQEQISNVFQFGCDLVSQDGHFLPVEGLASQTVSAKAYGQAFNFVSGASAHWNADKTVLTADYTWSVWTKKDGAPVLYSAPIRSEYSVTANNLKIIMKPLQSVPGFEGGECNYVKVQ